MRTAPARTDEPAGRDAGPDAAVATRDVLLIALAACALLAPSLFTRDLWTPDEPRYMSVALEMSETGGDAWIVPRLNGALYTEKPPFFFWAAAALYRCGAGLLAGRLVSLAAAVGTVLLTYAFVLPRRGRGAAILSALALATTWLFLDEVKTGVINPLLAFLTTAAAVCAFGALHAERASVRWRMWLVAYVALAAACLTKGPVALLVVGVPVAVYAAWNRASLRTGTWVHAAGAAVVLGAAALWLVPAASVAGWDYVRSITVGQVERRVVASDAHRAPPWEYLVKFMGHFFPWAPAALVAGFVATRRWRGERDGLALFTLLWFVGGFVAFSAISGKRGGYLLPLIPAFAVIVGTYVDGLRARGSVASWDRRAAFATAAACALIGVVATGAAVALAVVPEAIGRLRTEWETTVTAATAGSSPALVVARIVCGVAIAWIAVHAARAALRGRVTSAWVALGAWAVAVSVHIDVFVTPVFNEAKSARRFVQEAAPFIAARELRLFGSEYSGLYNLYTGRTQIPEIGSASELEDALCARMAVIGEEKWFERRASSVPWREHVMLRRLVGHHVMLVVGESEVAAASR